jgi:hypothetical protein
MPSVAIAIGRLLAAGTAQGVRDADLIAQYVAHRDEAAFTELAHRHGRMVLSVARRAIRDHQLAEDVAQAVLWFWPGKPANWLIPIDWLAGCSESRHDLLEKQPPAAVRMPGKSIH